MQMPKRKVWVRKLQLDSEKTSGRSLLQQQQLVKLNSENIMYWSLAFGAAETPSVRCLTTWPKPSWCTFPPDKALTAVFDAIGLTAYFPPSSLSASPVWLLSYPWSRTHRRNASSSFCDVLSPKRAHCPRIIIIITKKSWQTRWK